MLRISDSKTDVDVDGDDPIKSPKMMCAYEASPHDPMILRVECPLLRHAAASTGQPESCKAFRIAPKPLPNRPVLLSMT